jgi:hypothetical protein
MSSIRDSTRSAHRIETPAPVVKMKRDGREVGDDLLKPLEQFENAEVRKMISMFSRRR